jgi:hypothetical protein
VFVVTFIQFSRDAASWPGARRTDPGVVYIVVYYERVFVVASACVRLGVVACTQAVSAYLNEFPHDFVRHVFGIGVPHDKNVIDFIALIRSQVFLQQLSTHLLLRLFRTQEQAHSISIGRPKLAGWLAGWLGGWLGARLAGWLAGLLAGWLVGWLAGWLAEPRSCHHGHPVHSCT